jgi:hypothetical protein
MDETIETKVDLNLVLELIDQLPPTEKLLVRRHLEQDWAERLAALLDRIQAGAPTGISDDEVAADVAEAIREVRAGSRDA